jgi:predicted AAA+ superfamily ATPase
MERAYDTRLSVHLAEDRQMAMVTGPRQVGKTTSARASAGDHHYLTWDRQPDRRLLLQGADAVAQELGLETLSGSPRHVVFDEIHKYRKWKDFLKGFFDVYGEKTRLVVTGSARLGFFRRGGDSLMGRYFLYRMHPLSVAEIVRAQIAETETSQPLIPPADGIDQLLRFGGFPEPFLKATTRFHNRWRRLRNELLFREDLRDLTQIQEAGQVEVLGDLLASRAGQLLNYSALANDINASVDTVRRWIGTLESLFYCYTLRPWFRNVPKSLRKQPKVYLWDWSLVAEPGARRENFVASHLLKAVHWWTDAGFGTFDLRYLRDKAKREVDFVVVRDGTPWFLVEVKTSGRREISSALRHFHQVLDTSNAFQLSFDLDFVDEDCFSVAEPVRVPAATMLSQLV